MYDPCIGSYVWEQNHGPIVPFAVKDKKVLERNASFLTQLQARDKTCGYADFRKKNLAFPQPGNHGGRT
jgi:carboxypeptidase D